MRWWLSLLLASLLLIAPFVRAEPWGCCIPPVGLCMSWADGGYESQQELTDACNAASTEEYAAILQGAGQYDTCNPFSECQIGCCCAGETVDERYTVNSDENQLRITFAACTFKQGFEPQLLPPGSSCVDVCGGIATPPPEGDIGTFTVSGIVTNGTGTAPLAGAEVFIPLTGGEISGLTNAQGQFTLTNISEMSTRLIASHPACTPALSDPLAINKDLSGVSIALQCSAVGCTHAPPVIAQAPQIITGTPNVSVTVTFTDACYDLLRFELHQCDANFGNCQHVGQSSSPTIIAPNVPSNTTICFKVGARFEDNSVAMSASASVACITTGDAACMQDREESLWCGIAGAPASEAILSCDQSNKLIVQACDPNMICSTRSGTPQCIAPPACEQCNGLVGLFAKLLASLQIPSGLFTVSCESACVLDSERAGNPLLVDAFASCSGVGSCSHYRSPDACGADLCGVSGCSWTMLNEELGQGICVAQDEVGLCEQCDDLFGFCTKDMCEAISDSCYFDGLPNGFSSTRGCMSKENAACRYYDVQGDCVGIGADAVYNIQYDSDNARSGGDNARTVSSDDALGIGACTWINATSICIKNADMRGGAEDDCIESGRIYTDPTCVQDSTPPTTTFLLADTPYSRTVVRSLPYTVTDDRTPVDDIATFVCFSSAATPCAYPTEKLSLVTLPEIGSYDLLYYSMDANGNSEVVKSIPIDIIDTGEPAVESIDIIEQESAT